MTIRGLPRIARHPALTLAAALVWVVIGLLVGLALSSPHSGTQPPDPAPSGTTTTHP